MSEEKNERTQIIDDKDWFLQDLVDIVNTSNTGFSFGITLNVGGFLVSGQLIGGKEYFESFGSDFAGAFFTTFPNNGEDAENIKASFARNGEIYSSNDEVEVPPPNYIHLKDAKFHNTNGEPIPSNRGVLWRGRLSGVDGFSLGSFTH